MRLGSLERSPFPSRYRIGPCFAASTAAPLVVEVAPADSGDPYVAQFAQHLKKSWHQIAKKYRQPLIDLGLRVFVGSNMQRIKTIPGAVPSNFGDDFGPYAGFDSATGKPKIVLPIQFTKPVITGPPVEKRLSMAGLKTTLAEEIGHLLDVYLRVPRVTSIEEAKRHAFSSSAAFHKAREKDLRAMQKLGASGEKLDLEKMLMGAPVQQEASELFAKVLTTLICPELPTWTPKKRREILKVLMQQIRLAPETLLHGLAPEIDYRLEHYAVIKTLFPHARQYVLNNVVKELK